MALARAGHADQALRVAADIDNPGSRTSTLSFVAKALAEAGEARQALQLAADIREPNIRAQALRWVAQALADAGQSALAADAASRAIRAAADIDDRASRAGWLSALVRPCGSPRQRPY